MNAEVNAEESRLRKAAEEAAMRGGRIIPLGDLMREATRLSRICFISLISPRKKLTVSSFFENDSSLHDFLSRGLPHQQAANEESTLLKGGKATTQVRECNELLMGEKQKKYKLKIKTGQNKYKPKKCTTPFRR